MTVYTIGHSVAAFDAFLAMLRRHDVRTIVDVRSSPYSRHAPQFSKSELSASLGAAGIGYVYDGRSLGGRPEEASCYRKGVVPPDGAEYLEEVDYAAVMRQPWFLEGIERLLRLASETPTAVLCSEADPSQCHRHHLIAAYIGRAHPSVKVVHIVEKGSFSARHLGSKADDPTVIQPSLF
jgi:uncharacterized protein (DUF488 family)